ncbi:MAG: threonylcarbamoyl-AMP synthase [Lachnospiraceae bacterium]|nr:threonylcarbamoyl-AMP synthase [Lachnospiraceae bacterium]
MKTEWIRNPSQEDIRRGGEIIKNGGLVAFPTETVYGLGGDALQADSSMKIYAAKGRPSDNPLIVHICRMEDLSVIAEDIPDIAHRLAEKFWPGPLTMILKKSSRVPKETTGGLSTVAVRFPNHEVALALIREAGGFIAAPSANTSGRPSPTVGKYVYEDLDGRVDMILDGGDSAIGLESTIVDLTENVPVVLRPGFITLEQLCGIAPQTILDPALAANVITGPGADPAVAAKDITTAEAEKQITRSDEQINTDSPTPDESCLVDRQASGKEKENGLHPKAPGMKYRHYAPKGMLTIIGGSSEKVSICLLNELKKDKTQGYRTGVIVTKGLSGQKEGQTDGPADDREEKTGEANEEWTDYADSIKVTEDMAHDLFRFLREFDDELIEKMYAPALEETGLGLAVMNRLKKAAGGRVIKAD